MRKAYVGQHRDGVEGKVLSGRITDRIQKSRDLREYAGSSRNDEASNDPNDHIGGHRGKP
jgi:hypothetical protein